MRHAVSGPPSDTGPVVHNLYVLVVGGNAAAPNDRKSRELTLAILKYIHDRLPIFTKMGVNIRVHKVNKSDLRNARLVEAMKRRGISSLPALVTPNNTYIGNRSIGEVYEKNIAEYQAFLRQDTEAPTGIAQEDDDLSNFYRSEMTFEKAEIDDGLGNDEGGIGEGSDMMDAYRQMMERRETRETKGSGRGQTAPPKRGSAPAPPKRGGAPAPAGRPDNVAPRARGTGDSMMDSLIDRMAGDIDAQTFEDAFTGGGGDSLDLDGGTNAQDDLMEKAYWANQELSM